MPRLQGLIFDLDGTLLDSAADLRQAINATLLENGREELSLDEVKSMTGDGMIDMINRAFMATGEALRPEQASVAFNQFITHYSNVTPDRSQLYPHVLETLTHYHSVGIKLGLCTNKQEESTRRLLKDLTLTSYFDFVAGGDTFAVRKPHAGHVRGVVEALGLPTSACVMIGDSPNDVTSAKGASVACLVVTHGYGTDVKELDAQGIVANFLELPKALQKLGFDCR